MNLENSILSELYQAEKDKCYIHHLYVKSKKSIQINLYSKQNSLRDKKQIYDYQRGKAEGEG